MSKTCTSVKFKRPVIANILASQTNPNEAFTFEELVDAQKFCGFVIKIDAGEVDGMVVTKEITLDKQEVDNLLMDAAKRAAGVEGASSSVIKYTFAEGNGPRKGCFVELVEVILNSLVR